MCGMPAPTLVVVSGPPGSGKTTLAHEIARAVGCPAICRDEIKEGMVHANPGFVPSTSDPLTMRTLTTFFDVLGLLVQAGATVVAEAAFQDKIWRPRLEPLTDLADIRIVHCVVDPAVAQDRIARRLEEDAHIRKAHVDRSVMHSGGERPAFVPVSLPVPQLHVDTSDGYQPGIAEIVSFVDKR